MLDIYIPVYMRALFYVADPTDMDLIRIDVQDEGSFVLECNSGEQIVAAFQQVSHQLKQLHQQLQQQPQQSASSVKIKGFAATVSKVRTKEFSIFLLSCGCATTHMHVRTHPHAPHTQDPTGKLPSEVVLIPFTTTLDLCVVVNGRPDEPLVRWKYEEIKQYGAVASSSTPQFQICVDGPAGEAHYAFDALPPTSTR